MTSIKPKGRKFSPAQRAKAAEKILAGIASGLSLSAVVRDDPSLPDASNWFDWIAADESLRQNYARAVD